MTSKTGVFAEEKNFVDVDRLRFIRLAVRHFLMVYLIDAVINNEAIKDSSFEELKLAFVAR